MFLALVFSRFPPIFFGALRDRRLDRFCDGGKRCWRLAAGLLRNPGHQLAASGSQDRSHGPHRYPRRRGFDRLAIPVEIERLVALVRAIDARIDPGSLE